jgi:DNA-3-methyladenine glycosylase II
MADLIEEAGPYRLRPEPVKSPFQHLARAILAQQISGRAALTITARVITACGLDPLATNEFPTPAQLLATSEASLRAAGVSRSKLLALQDLAQKTLQGLVPESHALQTLDDDVIIQRLTVIRGVGPWTAQMMLIFQLGRPDVMAATDYGVRKGFKLWYRKRDLPSPQTLANYAQRWAPYRSAACWYLWRAVELRTQTDA